MPDALRRVGVLVGAVAIAACSGASEATEPVIYAKTGPNSVSVTPASVVLNPGQTVQFRAAISPAVANPRWLWTSSDTLSVAIDSAGLARGLKAAPGVALCATLQSEPNKKGCAQIVIQAR